MEVDPALSAAIRRKQPSINAVFMLFVDESSPQTNRALRKVVTKIISQAIRRSGFEGRNLQLFPDLWSFAISGPSGYIKAILKAGSQTIEVATYDE